MAVALLEEEDLVVDSATVVEEEEVEAEEVVAEEVVMGEVLEEDMEKVVVMGEVYHPQVIICTISRSI